MSDAGWHMGWMMIWPVLGLVILVGVIWMLVSLTTRRPTPTGESPEDILKRRYARGEIDPEEFRRRLEDLRK